jgi:glycerol uptake facilitator-like aquaporin
MGGENNSCCLTCKVNMSRLIYELIGTLLLTMTFLTHGAGPGKILMAVWILTVFCWKVSGSHFNPIISFAYIFRRDTSGLPRCVMLLYMLV